MTHNKSLHSIKQKIGRIAVLAILLFALLAATTAGVQAGGTNNSPVITEGASTSVTMSEESTPTAFSLTLNASDLDGDLLTWSIKTQATHGTATASGTGDSKAIGYTPNANYSGSDSFVVQVADGQGGTDTITINVTIENSADAPVITEGASVSRTMSEDGSPTAFSLTLNATDPDPGTTLTWSIFTQATNGTATASGTGTSKAIGYSPTSNYSGSDSFVVRVSDGSLTDSITVNVTIEAVNDTPVITEGTSVSRTMSEDGAPTAFSLTLNATDVDSATLTWSISVQASNGTAAASGTGSSKAIAYTPNANYSGSDSFNVSVSDGSQTDTIGVNVTVQPVNDPPTANAQSVTTRQDVPKAISLSGSDIEGSPLTFNIAGSPANGSLSGSAPNVTYTPNNGFQGSDSFTFTANDGTTNSTPATVSITVGPANVKPVADAQSLNTPEDTPISFTLTASDGDGDPLAYSLVTSPTNGTLTGTPPNITYTPNANFNGADSFTYKANDGLDDSNIATVTITVTPVNDAPVLAAIGDKGISELVNLGFGVSASDIDGDSLTYGMSFNSPAGASIHPTSGAFTWTPTEAQGPGSYTFDICVNDNEPLADCETITITVTEVNSAPVLDPIGSKSAVTGELLTFSATSTDSDLPANTLTYSLVGAPAGSSIDPATGAFTWTPPTAGTYTFDVVVSDGTLTDTETITVTVSEPVFYLFMPLAAQNQ